MKRYTAAAAIAALALTGCADVASEETPTTEPKESPTFETQEDTATTRAELKVPDLKDFRDLSGSNHTWNVKVVDAYTDDDGMVTDGWGTQEYAADGNKFVVFNVDITNKSDVPIYWSHGESTAIDSEGRVHTADWDAEFAASDDYQMGDLNPGTTVETDAIFEVPEDTDLTSVQLSGDYYADPINLEP